MIASGDLRAYLRGLSHQVWTDQNDAIQHGFTLQEETITEMLLLRMARELSPSGLKIKMFTKTEEGGYKKKDGTIVKQGNGADWEWFVELPSCKVGFRVQAKRLFPSMTKPGRYDSFKPKDKQIDWLIKSSGEMNPIYVLFNHKHVADSSYFSRSATTNWHGRSAWGCSVASAQFMKDCTTNKLEEIYPGSIPWHRFFAVSGGARYGCAVGRMMQDMAGKQDFRTAEERPDWVNDLLSSPPSISRQIDATVDQVDFFDARQKRLSNILSARELDGVAYFDFRDFDGD